MPRKKREPKPDPKGQVLVQFVTQPPGSEKAIQDDELQVASLTAAKITSNLDYLKYRSEQGDTAALEALYKSALRTTNMLNALLESSPDLLKKFASKQSFWPVVYLPPYKSSYKALQAFLKQISLGTQPELLSPMSFGQPTVPKELIARIQTEVLTFQAHQGEESERAELLKKWPEEEVNLMTLGIRLVPPQLVNKFQQFSLPQFFRDHRDIDFERKCVEVEPLRLDNWEEWYQIIKEYLMIETDGHPEKVEQYRSVGRFRERHGHAEPKSEKAEQNIRDGLWMEIKANLKRWVGFKK